LRGCEKRFQGEDRKARWCSAKRSGKVLKTRAGRKDNQKCLVKVKERIDRKGGRKQLNRDGTINLKRIRETTSAQKKGGFD